MLVKVKTFVKSMLPKINWGGVITLLSVSYMASLPKIMLSKNYFATKEFSLYEWTFFCRNKR